MFECVSSIATAALFEAPEPRSIASRPVCWIAATIEEGAAVPSMEMSCEERSAVTLVIPADEGQGWVGNVAVESGPLS